MSKRYAAGKALPTAGLEKTNLGPLSGMGKVALEEGY